MYVAPEIMASGRYSNKVDTYSFGICLVSCIRSEETIVKFMLHGLRRHMKKRNLNGLGFGILSKRMNDKGWRPPLPKKLYKSLKKLIKDCWALDPEKRPTFDEIVKRLLDEVKIEVELKPEPVFTCNYPNPANNDSDYDDKNGNDEDEEEEDFETEIQGLRIKLSDLADVEKRNEELEMELAKTKRMLKSEGSKNDGKEEKEKDKGNGNAEEPPPAIPAFIAGLLAGR